MDYGVEFQPAPKPRITKFNSTVRQKKSTSETDCTPHMLLATKLRFFNIFSSTIIQLEEVAWWQYYQVLVDGIC